MADHDEASGPGSETGVEEQGNDGFADAFAAFAGGTTPPADEPQDNDEDADAGQPGDEDGGDEPPVDEAEGEDPPADAPGGAPPADGDEADPWATATPAQIAARDRMIADYEARVRGAAGRASGLQKQLNALQSDKAAPTPPAVEKPEQSEADKVLADKIKQLREDYPEIAGPIIDLMEAQRAELGTIRGMVAPVIEANETEAIAEQARALEATHPDWRDYAPEKNADFRGWIEAQPPAVKAMAESYDAREVGVALTLFKAERAEAIRSAGGGTPPAKTATTDVRRQRQLDGGKAVGGKAGNVAAGAPDDFETAFAHFAAKGAKK